MQTIYNEHGFGKSIFENGFSNPNGISYREIVLLARYLRETFDYGEVTLRKKLLELLLKSQPNFAVNTEINRDRIKRAISLAMKDVMMRRVEEPVMIYKSEIESIRKVKHFKAQVFLLSLLIFSKWKKSNIENDEKGQVVFMDDYSKVIQLANISTSYKKILVDFHVLYRAENLFKIISFPKDKTVKCFASLTLGEASGEIAMRISEFRDIRKQYIEFLGGEIFYCKQCSKEDVKKNNRQSHGLCSDCYREYRKKYKAEKKRNKKDKKGRQSDHLNII